MTDTYTKLFSSITESTVWGEPYATRVVWVTMLAMADARGNVYGALPGLARRANVSLAEVEAALLAFMSPDPYSRTKDDDGRRIAEIDGGWNLLTHGKYSAMRSAEERSAYKAQWAKDKRAKSGQAEDTGTVVDKTGQAGTNVDDATPPALTPAPVKKDPKHVRPAASRSRFDDFWLAYPNKKKRKDALKNWIRDNLDARADELIAHVALMMEKDHLWRTGFVPMGATYLNQARWDDVPQGAPESGKPAPTATSAVRSGKPAGPSETPLEAAIAHARQQFRYQVIDEAERDRLIAEATEKHRRKT